MGKGKVARILVVGHQESAVRMAGGEPIAMSYTDERVADAVRHPNIHGLLLTGGNDVDPSWYGAKRGWKTQTPWEKRDLVEIEAVDAAVERGIPIFGICRGMQVMNVALGGTLHQHVPDLRSAHGFHQGHEHRVRAAAGSRIAKAFGSRAPEPWVVSLHHQAVATLGDGMVPTCWSFDELVEGFESVDGGWRVGVQFHPEMAQERAPMRGLFRAFVAAAASTAGLPAPRPVDRTITVTDKWVTTVEVPRNAKGESYTDRERRLANDRMWKAAARQRALPPAGPVSTSWMCFRCTIEFDERQDHLDHMWFIHNVRLGETPVTEDISSDILERYDAEPVR